MNILDPNDDIPNENDAESLNDDESYHDDDSQQGDNVDDDDEDDDVTIDDDMSIESHTMSENDNDNDKNDEERANANASNEMELTHEPNANANVTSIDSDDEYDDYESDEEDERQFKKLENVNVDDFTKMYHNDIVDHNNNEAKTLSQVVRDEQMNIIDDLHKTLPILTKYERARILGQRAKQINDGAPIFVKPKQETMDGYLIAQQELEEKKVPFIIRRPLPFGGCEYWKVSDLEILV